MIMRNVGDKVKIRSLDWYNQNKDNIGCIGSFVPEMAEYCGQQATIVESLIRCHMIDIDGRMWYWTDDMFEA